MTETAGGRPPARISPVYWVELLARVRGVMSFYAAGRVEKLLSITQCTWT